MCGEEDTTDSAPPSPDTGETRPGFSPGNLILAAGAGEDVVCCPWERKTMQLLWKTVWRLLKN